MLFFAHYHIYEVVYAGKSTDRDFYNIDFHQRWAIFVALMSSQIIIVSRSNFISLSLSTILFLPIIIFVFRVGLNDRLFIFRTSTVIVIFRFSTILAFIFKLLCWGRG